jgi:hypothetical protein
VYAVVTFDCDTQPKNFPPGTFPDETDVYPPAKTGDVVIAVNAGFSWDGRPTWQCNRLSDAETQIIYADHLWGFIPTEVNSNGQPTNPIPNNIISLQ